MEIKEKNWELIREYKNTGDNEVLTKLINANKRLIHNMAFKLSDTLNPIEDLYQFGVIGFIEGVRKFQGSKGTGNPITYIYYYIRLRMQRGKVLSLVSTPACSHMAVAEGSKRFSDESRALLKSLKGKVSSLDGEDSLGRDMLGLMGDTPEFSGVVENEIFFDELMELLSPRERKVITLMFRGGYSLKEIGDMQGTSRQNIHITKEKAFKVLRVYLEEVDYGK